MVGIPAGRSGDRIPVGAKSSAPIQTGAHPASHTVNTGSFWGALKRPRHGVKHSPPSSAEVKERVELYLCSHSMPSWQVRESTLLSMFIFRSLFPFHSLFFFSKFALSNFLFLEAGYYSGTSNNGHSN